MWDETNKGLIIAGYLPLTLLDFPGKVASMVFLSGCNMRCPYCHNSEILLPWAVPDPVDEGFVRESIQKRTGIIDGVVISGGEPLLQNIKPFLEFIKSLNIAVKLDTNGLRPDTLGEIIDNGLVDYVAMDIKNSIGKYQLYGNGIVSIDTDRVLRSIELLRNGSVDHEFRTTVVSGHHADEDFHEIGRLVSGEDRFYLQKFIMRDTVPDKSLQSPTDEDMKRYGDIMANYVKNVTIR